MTSGAEEVGKRFRILLLIRALGFGGAERQLTCLANGLARRAHTVTIATFYAGDAFGCEVSDRNPEITALEKAGRWDVLGFSRRLRRAVAARRPDIIYSFLPAANLLAAAVRETLRPRPAVVWGIRGTPLDLGRYDWLERASIRLERLAGFAPDLVIANSQAGAAWAGGAKLRSKPTAVVPNGVDTEIFRPATPRERAAARAALGCPQSEVIVAVVARLDPMKDHANFLQALAIARRAEPRLRGLLVGNGAPGFTAELRARADALGVAEHVTWANPRRDVSEVYRAADMLCLPSAFGEGFPNVVGEAMASGLHCVVTAVGDCAKLLGDTGWLVPPACSELLGEALLDCTRTILQNPTSNIAARQRILQHFGMDTMISATEILLQQVARRNPYLNTQL